MDFVLLSLLNGVSYGLLLLMVSAGLTLIFGMMGVLNFAHGSFYMLGAYFGYTFARYGNFWVALVYPTSPTMAQELGMIIFVVVVVGGLGSIEGALVASLTIGIFSSFAVGLDWTLAGLGGPLGLDRWLAALGGLFTVRLSTLAGAIPFLLMLVILLVRPAGLMGERA